MLLKRGKSMLRMGIALFLTLAFAAYICFFAEKRYTQPHRTFSALLAAVAELGGARAPHFHPAAHRGKQSAPRAEKQGLPGQGADLGPETGTVR